MRKKVIVTFLIMGPCVSIFMFVLHALFSKYTMHPLALIMCLAPTIIASFLLVLKDEDY